MSLLTITCPNCKKDHEVEYYSFGDCECGWCYYWDDGWDYETEEHHEANEGHIWEKI